MIKTIIIIVLALVAIYQWLSKGSLESKLRHTEALLDLERGTRERVEKSAEFYRKACANADREFFDLSEKFRKYKESHTIKKRTH